MAIFSGCPCCIGRRGFLAGGLAVATASFGAQQALSQSQTGSAGGETAALPDYAPLLPRVKARAWAIDPQKGYVVKELKPDIFIITDGGYQSLFAATGNGVVLFDAPPSFARHIGRAVAEMTREPIAKLVYSHMHVDHIGGAGLLLQQNPGIEIVAEDGVARFLSERSDPSRPVPTATFREQEALTFGSMKAEMKVGYWHSPPGDLFIHFPHKKVLMAVDMMSSGSVPYMGLDLTMNTDAYIKVFDQLLSYDFDVLVPGHHSNPSTRDDVRLVRDYVRDVYQTMKRIHQSDHEALISRATQKYGIENSYAIARVLFDGEIAQGASEIKNRWMTKLDNVDVWADSHCSTALVYYEWDIGPGSRS
jgi:glyoxylase-like metal-dependent hydrolase (beta-lactamase superfamily II)